MAEFKLGRIRFVWKGTWTPSVSYLIDDVISNGGKSYICVVNFNYFFIIVTFSSYFLAKPTLSFLYDLIDPFKS